MPGEKMISPERIRNAHYAAEVAYRYDNHIRPAIVAALEADDAFRSTCKQSLPVASTPPVDPQEKEPVLPAPVEYRLIDGQYGYCRDWPNEDYNTHTGSMKWHLHVKAFLPEELEAIAAHMRWRSRPKPAPVPEVRVNRDAYDTIIDELKGYFPSDCKHHIAQAVCLAISKALRASGSDGKGKA
jgi:hypothetical protein